MTALDKSIAKLAWLSPHTHSMLGWKATKLRAIIQIFPLIGSYYLFKKDENDNIVIETILDELKDVVLPDNFFKRIENEQLLLVLQKNNSFLENSTTNGLYSFINSLKKCNTLGTFVWKGFEKDLPEYDNNEYIIFKPLKQKDCILKVEAIHFEYLATEISKLSKEDKQFFIYVLDHIIKNFKKQTYKSGFISAETITRLNYNLRFPDFDKYVQKNLKNLIQCLKKE